MTILNFYLELRDSAGKLEDEWAKIGADCYDPLIKEHILLDTENQGGYSYLLKDIKGDSIEGIRYGASASVRKEVNPATRSYDDFDGDFEKLLKPALTKVFPNASFSFTPQEDLFQLGATITVNLTPKGNS